MIATPEKAEISQLNRLRDDKPAKKAEAAEPESRLVAQKNSECKKRKNSKKENAVKTKKTCLKRKENPNIISFALQGKESDFSLKMQKVKCRICLQIFEAFKKNENFKNFKKFAKIEKSLFSNCYEKLSKMAAEIREIFNEYFSSLAVDAVNYPKIFSLFSHFENVYKEYESKKFLNETRNILEIKKKMNKLQKIVKFNKYAHSNLNAGGSHESRFLRFDEYGSFHAHEAHREKRISNKFKLELLNNIKALNTEQVRGMLKILQDSGNGLDAQNATSVELDINKLSANKVKELDKYVRRCILDMKNRELRNFRFSSAYNVNANKNLNLNSEFNFNNNSDKNENPNNNNHNLQDNDRGNYLSNKSENNYLLGKKHNRDFFETSAQKQLNNNNNFNMDSDFYFYENNQNLFDNSKKSNKICITNNISTNALNAQNSFTNAETPNSNINKSKFEKGNSLNIESDAESDESSEEESYSDLEIGNFRI